MPFVEINGEEIADSAIIIKELSQKFEQDIDAGLTQEQKNIAHATISMIENHLVWVIFYWRTKHPDQVLKGYKVNLQHALGTRIPNGILNFFFKFQFGRKVCMHGMNEWDKNLQKNCSKKFRYKDFNIGNIPRFFEPQNLK